MSSSTASPAIPQEEVESFHVPPSTANSNPFHDLPLLFESTFGPTLGPKLAEIHANGISKS